MSNENLKINSICNYIVSTQSCRMHTAPLRHYGIEKFLIIFSLLICLQKTENQQSITFFFTVTEMVKKEMFLKLITSHQASFLFILQMIIQKPNHCIAPFLN